MFSRFSGGSILRERYSLHHQGVDRRIIIEKELA